jgi:hypothetical protein
MVVEKNRFTRFDERACLVSRRVSEFLRRWFKSSQRNQTCFAFNRFRKPCNHPNLYFAA